MQTCFTQSIATPPSETTPEILSTAQTVLRAQAQGLTYIADLYDQDATTQSQFFLSLQYMHNAILSNGKIVITGMGKSFKIADKLVATMNSLGIHAAALHPSEALHGDLGIIKPTDVLILITSSGNTPELLAILPHISKGLPLLCLTCTPDSPLALKSTAILPAVLPTSLSEKVIYGLPAPTTSTTACLAVGDAVCITLAEMLISDISQRRKNFGKWHPGGAIGQDYSKDAKKKSIASAGSEPVNETTISIIKSKILPWSSILELPNKLTCSFPDELAVWRLCASHPWVTVDNGRFLVSTKSISTALLLQGATTTGTTWTDRLNKQNVKHTDLYMLRRCLESELSLLAVPSGGDGGDGGGGGLNELVVIYNETGDRIGLYTGGHA